MALIALVSAKGSPGVTAAALALSLVWPRRVLLAECDPAGGDITAGYLQGRIDPIRGLLELSVAARHGELGGHLHEHVIALDEAGERLLLPGLADPAQAPAMAPWWDRLVTAFMELHDGPALDVTPGGTGPAATPGTDVLADCGRLGTAHPPTPLLRRADLVVLVLRSSLRSLSAARPWVTPLRRESAAGNGGERLVALLVGESRPYSRREISSALGVPVAACLADDPSAAAVLDGEGPAGRRFAASPLLRSARSAAAALQERANRRRAATTPLGPPNGHRRTDGLDLSEVRHV